MADAVEAGQPAGRDGVSFRRRVGGGPEHAAAVAVRRAEYAVRMIWQSRVLSRLAEPVGAAVSAAARHTLVPVNEVGWRSSRARRSPTSSRGAFRTWCSSCLPSSPSPFVLLVLPPPALPRLRSAAPHAPMGAGTATRNRVSAGRGCACENSGGASRDIEVDGPCRQKKRERDAAPPRKRPYVGAVLRRHPAAGCRRPGSIPARSAVSQDVPGGPEAEGPARIRALAAPGPRSVSPLWQREKRRASLRAVLSAAPRTRSCVTGPVPGTPYRRSSGAAFGGQGPRRPESGGVAPLIRRQGCPGSPRSQVAG